MALKIEQGLFNLDFIDHHAILGVSVDAEIKEIRKRYLAVARRLHPDSCTTEEPADRQRASEYLSKLVNPAYEKLSNEKSYAEYCILLRLKGQQALKQQDTVLLTSDAARRVAASGNVESAYKAVLNELLEKQYQQLDQTLEITGQISELNLVYLMRKESRGDAGQSKLAASAAGSPRHSGQRPAAAPSSSAPAASRESSRESMVAVYLRRAHEYEIKQDYPRAILELRDALKLDSANSTCHSRLGGIYLKTNQSTMAKIHFGKALELNPQDAIALEGKRRLEGSPAKPAAAKPDAKGSKPAAKSNSDKGNGGLFGLFGNKKK
jgi:curved DNA-binding protein CbpA